MAAEIYFLLSLVLLFLKRPRATRGRDMRHVVLTGWRLCSVSIDSDVVLTGICLCTVSLHSVRNCIDTLVSLQCVNVFGRAAATPH